MCFIISMTYLGHCDLERSIVPPPTVQYSYIITKRALLSCLLIFFNERSPSGTSICVSSQPFHGDRPLEGNLRLIAADMGKLTLLGMLDLIAAFDCVDHSILLRRLEVSFGFGGAVLDWMRSYLVGRRQYIRYNGSMSSTTVVQFGVPQGFVLGPLFFILYTAAVFHIAEELGFFIHGYPDDLQLYDHCLARDTAQLSVCLAHCIEVMGKWMSSNRLKLNASKTEFIWLGSTRRLARCTFDPIVIGGVPIQPSSTVRDLGAYIDSGTSYMDHVTRLTRTCFFHIRQLRSIRRSLTVDSSHALVRALILTRLDYCSGLLGGAPKCILSPLSRILRAAARLILLLPLLLPRTSSVENEICTVLHWLDIPARVTFKLCLLAHQCLHGSAPPYLIRYLTPVSSICGRSHLCSAATGTVFVPGSRTSTIGSRAFAVSSPSAWNSLPVDLRDPGLSLLTFRH